MKNKELFDKTVSILVKAYQNETLVNSTCGCAVGNLVAANMGVAVIKRGRFDASWSKGFPRWNHVFTTLISGNQEITSQNYKSEAKRQIDSTGYSWQELAKVEKAFESARISGDAMFNGLMSVIDTLMLIHEATKEEANQAKELFTLTV